MNQQSFKLFITKPCTKDWDAMLQTNNGRHCNSCKKDVIDFSGMNDDEVKNYFLQNRNTEICGRFYSNQLDRIKIYLPQNILQSDISQWKKYVVILMICFGVNLFSVEIVLSQTIDSIKIKDSIKPIDSLQIEDSLKAIDTTLVSDSTEIPDSIKYIVGGAIQTVEITPSFVIAPSVDEIIFSTSMGFVQTIPDDPKVFIEILKEEPIKNEAKITISANGSSNPISKKPSKKQEPQQQQEYIIPDEIKIKKRK